MMFLKITVTYISIHYSNKLSIQLENSLFRGFYASMEGSNLFCLTMLDVRYTSNFGCAQRRTKILVGPSVKFYLFLSKNCISQKETRKMCPEKWRKFWAFHQGHFKRCYSTPFLGQNRRVCCNHNFVANKNAWIHKMFIKVTGTCILLMR